LKKLSNQLQPYREVAQILNYIVEEAKIQRNVRVLDHALSYAEFQFGDRVEGKSYRERGNGDQISNWIVEIEILPPVYSNIIEIYDDDQLLSTIIRNNMVIPYLEKMRQLLMPWSILIDSDDTNLTDIIDKDDTNLVLSLLFNSEYNLAKIYMHRNEYNLAESHCQYALSSANRYDGEVEEKASILCDAFRAYGELRKRQGNYIDSAIFYEEAYNCVAMAYNPVHPEVQKAAAALIECLIHTGDLYDAERFAQATLDSLKDPANGIDQNSEEMAKGYYYLGKVIHTQDGDLDKAGRLAREAHRIRIQLYGNDHYYIAASTCLLANILHSRGKLGDETKQLYESYLAITIKNEGLDGINTAVGYESLSYYYFEIAFNQVNSDTKKEHLCLAKSYVKETIRIFTKLFGSAHPQTVTATSNLADIERHLLQA
jgi:hypothetical protein